MTERILGDSIIVKENPNGTTTTIFEPTEPRADVGYRAVEEAFEALDIQNVGYDDSGRLIGMARTAPKTVSTLLSPPPTL